jgi:hypothetical protein
MTFVLYRFQRNFGTCEYRAARQRLSDDDATGSPRADDRDAGVHHSGGRQDDSQDLAFSKKRNVASYDSAGSISDEELKQILSAAGTLRQTVETWLAATHPELLNP